MEKRNRIILAAAIIGVVFGFYLWMAWINARTDLLLCREGRLTLEHQEPVDLKLIGGQWRVFEGEIRWDQVDWDGGELVDIMRIGSMEGHTFALEIETAALEQNQLMLPRPRGSRLYVNGEEVTGPNGAQISSTDVLDLSSRLAAGEPYTRLLLQVPVSGFFYSGYQGLLMGDAEELADSYKIRFFIEIACLGFYIALGAISLILYLQKPSEKYILWLILVIIFTAYRFISFSENLSLLISNIPFGSVYRLFFFLRYCLCCVFVPSENHRARDSAILLLTVACAAAFVFAPGWFLAVVAVANICALLIEGDLILRGFVSKRQGTGLLLIGWAVFIGMELFYCFLHAGVVPQGIIDVVIRPTQYAYLFYLLAFTGAILGKFSRKFQEAEELAATLEQKVQHQTQILREQNQSIIHMQQTRERFLTDMVHNIRNPLFALGGYFEFLEDSIENPNQQQQEYIPMINQKLDYLNRLVADMLLVDRLENGRISFNMVVTRLKPMLETVVRENSSVKQCKEVCIECDDLSVEMDAFRMRQALDNLVDNAVIHGKCSRLVVSARLKGEAVWITVADNGCGMTETQCQHAFDRYYTNGTQNSSGLGLSIASQIVRGHHGTISLTSVQEKGTTIEIALPLYQEKSSGIE